MLKIVYFDTDGAYSHKTIKEGIVDALSQMTRVELLHLKYAEMDSGQLEMFKPDWIITSTPLSHYTYLLKQRGYKIVGYDTEGCYEADNSLRNAHHFDVYATVDKSLVIHSLKNGMHPRPYHMPLGFSPKVFKKLDHVEDHYKSDILICGVMFDSRRDALFKMKELKDRKIVVICPKNWQSKIIMDGYFTLLDTVTPEEYSKYINGTKIVLCPNRDYYPSGIEGLLASTPGRSFHENGSTDSSVVFMDDSRLEIYDYFERDEIVLYKEDRSNLIEKINYYLDNKEERLKVANKGFIRSHLQHTFRHRIENLITYLLE